MTDKNIQHSSEFNKRRLVPGGSYETIDPSTGYPRGFKWHQKLWRRTKGILRFHIISWWWFRLKIEIEYRLSQIFDKED